MRSLFSKAGHNRRSICRIPLQLPIYLFMPNDSGREYKAMSVNLHYRGAEITTEANISRGTSVRMRLPQALTGRSTVATSGKVRWASNNQGQYSYGISFTEDFCWLFTLTKETLPALKNEQSSAVAECVLNSINDGVFSVNKKRRIISFNHAAEKLTGWQREEVIGRDCQRVFNGGRDHECILAKSIEQGIPIANRFLFMTTAQEKQILVKINTTPLMGIDGEITGGVQVFCRVSGVQERKRGLGSVVPLSQIRSPVVDIQTFGNFCLRMNGQPIYDRLWKGRRSKELLKAIIALGGTKVSMEKLSMLLWPDSDGDRALNNLKMALSRLRRIGGDYCSLPSNWLAVKYQRVSLIRSVCRVDALEFARMMEKNRNMESVQSLQLILSLYVNDFLPQDETAWIDPFRDYLRALFIEGVLRLASLKDAGDDVVLSFLEQARYSDPLHEGVYACLMAHYIEAGFPATALDIFHKAEKIISRRVGISPGAVLQSLANRARKFDLFH